MILDPLLSLSGPPSATLPQQQLLHPLEHVVLEDALLVAQVLADAGQLRFLDGQGARVLFHPVAGEYAHVDDGLRPAATSAAWNASNSFIIM